MPSLSKSRAIVLHLTRQGDSGAVVEVVDSAAGRQPLYLRGLGRGRGVSVSAFHSLALLDVVTYATPRSSLLYLREYSPAFPLDGIRSDMSKSTTALFISEVLYRTQKRDDGDPDLFKSSEEEQGETDYAELVQEYASEKRIWMGDSRFVAMYRSSSEVTAEESRLLHLMLGATLEEALEIPLSASRRLSFSRKMIKYLSIHFGAPLEIKSLDVLHAVFA